MVGFCGNVHKISGAITTKYLASPVKYLTPYFKTQYVKGAVPVAQQAYTGPTAQLQLARITYLQPHCDITERYSTVPNCTAHRSSLATQPLAAQLFTTFGKSWYMTAFNT